jgi:RNA polymerase sigma factor (sigma-70 family)
MKKYNIENYVRYKEDLKKVINNIQQKSYREYSNNELINLFLPLVENIAKKFSTSDQASGVMDIMDIIQEGSLGLIQAVEKIDWDKISNSDDEEKTLKSFLSKRIKGSIRRAIDINRGSVRIPEYKLNEIRRNPNEVDIVQIFFNSIFQSIDDDFNEDNDNEESRFDKPQYEDKSTEYNIDILNLYLFSLFKKYLNEQESEVLRLSFGLDCDRHSANQIADILGFKGPSAYVRVSELKKASINKLIENVDHSQVIDFL